MKGVCVGERERERIQNFDKTLALERISLGLINSGQNVTIYQ